MGASQSSSINSTGISNVSNASYYPLLFDYECNNHVADFILRRSEYFDELKRTVQAYAEIDNIVVSGPQGIVTLKPKVSASSSDKDACKQLLDDFFSRFLSFNEKLEKIIPRTTLDSIQTTPGLRCVTEENALQNSIRITGIQSDVKKMIYLLRDAQCSPSPTVTEDSSLPIQPPSEDANRPVPMPRNSSLAELPLSTYLVVTFQAPEFAVARFIKKSPEHFSKLQQAMAHLTQGITVDVSNPKDVKYVFRPAQGLRLSEEKFENMCKEQISDFLKNYSARKKRFNKGQLQQVNEINPGFFAKRSADENDGVFIQWHYDDALMIMAGPKIEVEKKENEILEFLNTTAPRYVNPRFVFRYPTQEFSVARFIKYSHLHSRRLDSSLKDVATVRIWINNEIGNEKDRRVEYQCRPLPHLEMAESEFKTHCRAAVRKFLESYISTVKLFDHDHLIKVSQNHPEFFERRTSEENEKLYVEWQLDKNRVRVAGLKRDVDSKVKEITSFLEAAEHRSVSRAHVFKLKSPDYSVTRFIKQSPRHLGFLEAKLSHLASVKIWMPTTKREDTEKIIEFHCRPIPNLNIPDDVFEDACRSEILNVLERYSSIKKHFNHDHLMKVVLKEKDFFYKRSAEENQTLFVEWQLLNNCVRIAGLKEEVNAKWEEISTFVENAVPKTLRIAYEFEWDSPSMQSALYIKQNNKHYELLKDAIEDAKVWITPGKCSLHFKATTELTQLDIPQFEAKCKRSARQFFQKYGVWRQKYSAAVLQSAVEQHSELFANKNDDFKVEILNENEIMLVGVRSQLFVRQRGLLMKTMQQLVNRSKALKSKTPQHQRTQPPAALKKSSSINSLIDLPPISLQPYLYTPNAKANKTIIKHIFQSEIDLGEFQHVMGPFIMFEVFPNANEPQGMKFYPDPKAFVDARYYMKELPGRIAQFMSKFSVSRKRIASGDDYQFVIGQVNRIGRRHAIKPRRISIHQDNDFLNIVGPVVVVPEISKAIGGINCYGENVVLRAVPDPRADQPPSRVRKSSISSASGEIPIPKPRTTTPKPSNTAPIKKTETKVNPMMYIPKKQFFSMFKFAWENPRFCAKFKSRFEDICTLSGSTERLKITPTNAEENNEQFREKVIKKMENFFSSITITVIELDADVINCLKENKEEWLESFFNPEDWVDLSFSEKGLEVKGFKEDVDKYIDVDTISKPAPNEVCRVLSICGVIAETNRQLGELATVSCSVDEGLITCKCRKLMTFYALKKLGEVGHLEEEAPLISEEKAKALVEFLTNKNHEKNEKYFEKKFADKKIKCVLILQSDKAVLTAMTFEMYKKGSKYIDELIQVVEVPFEDAIDGDVFKQKDWIDLKSDIEDSNLIIVEVQESVVRLVGVYSSAFQDAVTKIKAFFGEKMQSTQQINCKKYVGRFILKYCVPNNLEVSETPQGLLVNGPKLIVDGFARSLTKITWSRTQLTFNAPKLHTYFSSSAWKDFVKVLEHDIRCTVECDAIQHTIELEEEKEKIAAPGTSNQTDFSTKHVKETAYGSVIVSVGQGDITAEATDVIINGVIDRSFNLSRGAVPSALLKRAGFKMQEECNGPGQVSPMMRTTRGWNLLCYHVIHIVSPNKADLLKNRVKEALDHAELLKASSVAIPTIGAGGIGLSANDVAAALSQAIELFACDYPRHVKSVKIVVYERKLVDLFQNSIVQAKEIMGFGKRAAELAESRAKSSLDDDEVVVSLNTDDSDSLDDAKIKIVNSMSKVIVTKTFMEENLSKLQDNDRFDIYEAAVKHNASVNFNFISSEIVLKGLAENVSKLYDAIREVIFELKEAITMSKIANWKWASATSVYNNLPLRISRAIETEYERNKTGKPRVSMCGSDMWIDFSHGTFVFGLINGRIKRGDKDVMSTYPSEWEDMMGKPMIRVPLDSHLVEYNKVFNQFQASNPDFSQVLKIERIQNPTLYSQYQIYKRSVERNMISNHPVERELFHGTNKTGIENILQSGFDRNFAGKNAAVYGKGCYFAVSSRYSVSYVDQSSPVKYIILARVVTGDFCKGRPEMRAPPEKPSTGDVTQRYDSTVDNETDPAIFAVFKDSSVYPSYLITFC